MPETGYLAVFLIGPARRHALRVDAAASSVRSSMQVQAPGCQPQWRCTWPITSGASAPTPLLGAGVGLLGSVGLLYEGMLPVQMTLRALPT